MQLSGGNIPSRDLLLQLISIEEKVLRDIANTMLGSEVYYLQNQRVMNLRALLNNSMDCEFYG